MQKAKNKLISVLFVFLLLLQFSPYLNISPVIAGSLWDSQVGATEMGTAFGQGAEPTDIRIIIARVIKVFLALLGIIFLVLIIYAGFRWMTAGGNEAAITEAKSQLANAAIGLVIILMAYAITSYLMVNVFDITKL
jgi:hypothetical protein